jgi:hypothetical protein
MEQSPSWEANQWTLQLVKKFPAFMEPEIFSPYPQVPAACPYPEPTPSSPHDSLQLPEDPKEGDLNLNLLLEFVAFSWALLLLNRFQADCSASLIGSLKMISTYLFRIWQFETDIHKMSCCGLNCLNSHIIFTAFSQNVRIVACSAHRVRRETCILDISSVRTWCL